MDRSRLQTWCSGRGIGLASRGAEVALAFAAVTPVDLQDFDFLFPTLQADPANLLPESTQTVAHLKALAATMEDPDEPGGPTTRLSRRPTPISASSSITTGPMPLSAPQPTEAATRKAVTEPLSDRQPRS